MPLRVLCAPNAFKGSCSALAAAAAMNAGASQAGWSPRSCPVADGGDGLIEIAAALGFEKISTAVRGPLGQTVTATWLWNAEHRRAVIELAAASGLALLNLQSLNAGLAHSFGTGELIRAALDLGATSIVLGLGGSACSDGGSGMAKALGWRFLDQHGAELPLGGAALSDCASIDDRGVDPRLRTVQLQALCDVENPLTGARGAAAIFAPQKGADAKTVSELEAGLTQLNSLVDGNIGEIPGAGAAGGCGFGAMAFTGAHLVAGAGAVCDLVGLDQAMQECDLVLTGEGCLDEQSLMGKAPGEVARRAQAMGIPCIALAGTVRGSQDDFAKAGIGAAFSIVDGPISLSAALAQAELLIATATERICRAVAVQNTKR